VVVECLCLQAANRINQWSDCVRRRHPIMAAIVLTVPIHGGWDSSLVELPMGETNSVRFRYKTDLGDTQSGLSGCEIDSCLLLCLRCALHARRRMERLRHKNLAQKGTGVSLSGMFRSGRLLLRRFLATREVRGKSLKITCPVQWELGVRQIVLFRI